MLDGLHCILSGPCKTNARTTTNGTVEAMPYGLHLSLIDGKQARIVLDDQVAKVELAAALLGSLPAHTLGTYAFDAMLALIQWAKDQRAKP